jgi:glycosyltransferase involved in cell wall biosynthesis
VRVLYVTPHYAPTIGGVERHVAAIAGRVAAAGHDVEILTQTAEGWPRIDVVDGLLVRRARAVNRSSAFGFPPGVFTHVARHSPSFDVVHAHSYHALPALGALLAHGTRVVFTPHYHGEGHTGFARLLHIPYRPLGHALFRRADAVICVSTAERQLVERDVPGVRDRLTVIPNGVDVAAIRAAEPRPTDGPLLVAFGRLEPYKQLDRLIGALAELPPDWRLAIAGEGPARAGLTELVAASGLAGRVEILGRIPDGELRSLLRAASVVASLSRHEAYGLTLVEGLAAGASVVASDIPAHREVLEGQQATSLVPVDASAAAVAAAILERVAAGRPESVPETVVDWDEVAARTLSVYVEDVATFAA